MATMEKHNCKLCARTFRNGRALGGHMKGHLANQPLPPKTTPHHHQLTHRTDSASSSSSSSGEELEKSRETLLDDKSLGYGLRENPKKSFRFADPEFSFAPDSGSVIQDRESETESRNPTRRRSKRKPKIATDQIKKPKLSSLHSLIDSPPPTEQEPVSSVSDTSPEEDVAMCLVLLSRDAWKRNNVERKSEKTVESLEESKDDELSKEKKKINGKRRCGKCNKALGSYDTLDEHKRVCSGTKKTGKVSAAAVIGNDSKRFECPFCCRVFGSGQALGGHKRSHLLASASSSNTAANSSKFDNNLIDLNMPAPLEDDEFSVVSDA